MCIGCSQQTAEKIAAAQARLEQMRKDGGVVESDEALTEDAQRDMERFFAQSSEEANR